MIKSASPTPPSSTPIPTNGSLPDPENGRLLDPDNGSSSNIENSSSTRGQNNGFTNPGSRQSTPALAVASKKLSAAYQKLSNTGLLKKVSQDDETKFGIVLAGIVFLAAITYLSLAYSWPKFSRAEVFFAECVREMFLAENPVTPLYHGTPFFDKPILSYWTIAASYLSFGISHFTARIPSVLSAVGSVILTAIAAKHLFGPKAGTLAAAVLASSVMFISFANLCMSDMQLVFFDIASMGLLYFSLENEKRRSILLYIASLSLGLGFLTKGPVGIVLPVVSFAIYLTLTKQWKLINPVKHVLPCAGIIALAGIPWFMAAVRQNGLGALSYFFIHENLERFAGSTYDTHRPIWFMVVSMFGGMLPWSVFLPFAFKDSIASFKLGWQNPQNKSYGKHLFLWLWIAVVIGFFSVSRGKIDYYALPAYPAAAILIGSYLTSACELKAKTTKVFSWILGCGMFIAGIVISVLCARAFPEQNPLGWMALPAVLTSCGALMTYLCATENPRRAFKMLFVCVCLCSMAVAGQVYPWINSKQAVLKYIPYLKSVPETARVGVYTSLQNWIDEITFQTGLEPIRIDSPRMAEQFLRSRSQSVLLIQETDFNKMSDASRASCTVVASNPFIPRSLNPVYFITRGNSLGEGKLLLITSGKSTAILQQ